MKKIELKNNWKFKIVSSSNKYKIFGRWMDCKVPGTVHTDLLNLNLIEDPLYEDNELSLQWIVEQDWFYKTTFDLPENFKIDNTINLVFKGVDTIAEAWLNKEPVGKFQNMFRKYEFDISKILKKRNNLLELKIRSPIKYAKEQEKKYGKLPVALNSERVYIRKAQYSFGWDWGPSFPTSGLWKPVFIEQQFGANIKRVSFNTIEIRKDKAIAEVTVFIFGSNINTMSATVSLKDDQQSIIIKKGNLKRKNVFRIEIKNPKLWWPNGYNDQSLYKLKVELRNSNNKILDKVENKVGLRTVALKLKENKKPTFKFVINNQDIFIKGVNWIPADSFLPRVSKKNYEQLILAAKVANCNMIRVWGGGVYEQDYFYELCDEQGILVWQDFMFACGTYPQHKSFIDNIENEVTEQVERLQHHPSLALWCGNNENEWIWYQTQQKALSEMPGFKIFHELIPKIINQSDPGRPYWPSSPFSYNDDPNDQQSGNTHQWEIWSKWIDYSKVKEDDSLFVSEFGFQGPANINTLEKCLSPKHRNIQSEKFEFHNKQVEGQERVFKFLAAHLPVSTNWHDFNYLTQLNQGLALKSCIEHWRVNRPRTNGAIIWQLNDCWPVISWSLVDSSYQKKIAYYFVKKAFSSTDLLFKQESSGLKVYGLNQGLDSVKGYVKLVMIYLGSGEVIYENFKEVILKENSYKSVIIIPGAYQKNSGDYIYIASFYNDSNELINRNFYVTREWKHIQTSKSRINIKMSSSKKKDEVKLTANKPAYFVDLYHPKISFSDRGFILLPGEETWLKFSQSVKRKMNTRDLKIITLNNYLENKNLNVI
jgi:beta-mannosidase